jgi:Flp pilus assembly protein TadD
MVLIASLGAIRSSFRPGADLEAEIWLLRHHLTVPHAEQIRRGLGESLSSIGKYDAPIQDATTSSLEALKAYSLGVRMRRLQGEAASVVFFKQAIELDPNFALAYARLGTVYDNLGEHGLGNEYIQNAFALKDRVSEPERLYILARYYEKIENSDQRAIETYRLWIQTYPNDYTPRVNVAAPYRSRGEYDPATRELQAAIALAPDQPLPYANLADLYLTMGKVDDARKIAEAMVARGFDAVGPRTFLYVIAFLRHDEREMTRQEEIVLRVPSGYALLATECELATMRGQLARAAVLARRYADESVNAGFRGAAAQNWVSFASSAALLGNPATAKDAVTRALALDRSALTLMRGALALGLAADWAGAEKLRNESVGSMRSPGHESNGESSNTILKLIDALLRVHNKDPQALQGMPLPRGTTTISRSQTVRWLSRPATPRLQQPASKRCWINIRCGRWTCRSRSCFMVARWRSSEGRPRAGVPTSSSSKISRRRMRRCRFSSLRGRSTPRSAVGDL